MKKHILLITVAAVCCTWLRLGHAENTAAPAEEPRPLTVNLSSNTVLDLQWIPPGEFEMGSDKCDGERPPHKVKITRGFWMGTYEITQEQFIAITGDNPSRFKGPKRPVESVSWNSANAFIKKLNDMFSPRYRFRLPTEAEWEYACTQECPIGWYDRGSDRETKQVGLSQPNSRGLYDMLGNVSEWCADWYAWDYYKTSPATDPTGPDRGIYRVLRGASWDDDPGDCTPRIRNRTYPQNYDATTGFRLVMTEEK